MEDKYKGHVIESGSWLREDTGRFKCCVSVLRHSGDSTTVSPPNFLEEEFDTLDEAERFGVRFCRDVIDGRVRKWWAGGQDPSR